MTISEYIDAGYKIFSSTTSSAYPYLGTTGADKITKLLKNMYGSRELWLTSETHDATPTLYETDTQYIVDSVLAAKDFMLTKLYSILSLTYDPLKTVDMTEDETATNSGTDTDTDNGTAGGTVTVTPATTITENRSAFDAPALVIDNTKVASGNETTTNSATNGNTHTLQHGKKQDITRSRSGFEGVKIGDAILEEQKRADFDFYGEVAHLIADNIALLIYFFEGE